MVFADFASLRRALNAGGKRPTAAVACANDPVTLSAVARCRDEGVCDAVLIGDARLIAEQLEQLGLSGAGFPVVDEPDLFAASCRAVEAVRSGRAQFLLKGKVDTGVLLKAVVDRQSGLRTGRLMSHIAFLKIPNYHKLILLTDSGMVLYPTLAQKKEIVENAVETLRAMGYGEVKAGALAAVEKVNPKMQDTADAHALAEMSTRGEIAHCSLIGPVSYDILMDKTCAEKKGYASPVSEDADVMLVPDMIAGNLLGKALVTSANAQMAGIIVGAQVPIALTSRGAHAEEKYQSMLLAASCARGTSV